MNCSPSKKRKLSSTPTRVFVEIESPFNKNKKPKFIHAKIPEKKLIKKPPGMIRTSNATAEFPNGSFYCHQCAKKRDAAHGLQCTIKESNQRCKVKFCAPCLKNRYGESVEDIKSRGCIEDSNDHVEGEVYTFQCPKCRDICNCARCRKAKGLGPTGNLTLIARKSGAGSAAKILSKDPKAAGILPKQGLKSTKGTIASFFQPRAEPKPLPSLKWSKVPLSLSLEHAEKRFQIREFVLRFSGLMDVSQAHLDELEYIGGINARGRGWDDDDDTEEMTDWISETCAKNIVLGLLGLFVNEEKGISKIIKDSIKEIRACGAILSKIWAFLMSLRDAYNSLSSPPSNLTFNFPDPLPAPTSAKTYNTRGARSSLGSGSSMYIAYALQLVPVLSYLIEAALETKAVKEELDNGLKEGKDRTREKLEASRKENERWEKEKVIGKTVQAQTKRASHKNALVDLDMALKISLNAYTPRFGPLGTDNDGRVYWALSPGSLERELAQEFITASAGEKTERRNPRSTKTLRKLMLLEDERSAMKTWSWFVGVWGQKPLGNDKHVARDSSESESEEEDEECWWGFWSVDEIRKLAEWVSIKAELEETRPTTAKSTTDSDDDVDMTPDVPTPNGISHLVQGLQEYANLLEWRIDREDVAFGGGDSEVAEERLSTVPPNRFYQ